MNPFRVAVNGLDRALMFCFQMGSWDEKGWEPSA